MDGSVDGVYLPLRSTRLSRPLIMWRVPAGFLSPPEDYVEGRIDLSRSTSRHSVRKAWHLLVSAVPDVVEPPRVDPPCRAVQAEHHGAAVEFYRYVR